MHYIVYKFIFPDGFTYIGSSKNEIKTRIHDGKYGGLFRQYLLDHGYVDTKHEHGSYREWIKRGVQILILKSGLSKVDALEWEYQLTELEKKNTHCLNRASGNIPDNKQREAMFNAVHGDNQGFTNTKISNKNKLTYSDPKNNPRYKNNLASLNFYITIYRKKYPELSTSDIVEKIFEEVTQFSNGASFILKTLETEIL